MTAVFRTLLVVGCFIVPFVGAWTPSATAATFDHAIGLSYVSGFSDVVDFYDSEPDLSVDSLGPIGISYRFVINLDVGVRFDVGVGPIAAVVGGDVSYYDVPFQATAGYSLFPHHTFRPYVRGGFTYHLMDGDRVTSDAGTGLLGAVGVEIGKRGRISFFAEVAVDTAEATFEHADTSFFGGTQSGETEDINVTGTVVTVGVVF